MATLIILPTDLFNEPALDAKEATATYIIEHPHYFKAYDYHKMKLVFHRATMKKYADTLKDKKYKNIRYIEFKDATKAKISEIVRSSNATMYEPCDNSVAGDFKKVAKKPSPLFINSEDDLKEYGKTRKGKSPTHESFYKWMRKRHDILMTEKGKPQGGRWTYDNQNRESFPKTADLPNIYNPRANSDPYTVEAIKYVRKYFPKNPGSDTLYLPIDRDAAMRHFRVFLKNRLADFGPYEDAIRSDVDFGYHSVMSPLLNVGFVEPLYVVKSVVAYSKDTPIQSVEGFIRQVIGWREYVRLMYVLYRSPLERSNTFKNRYKLPDVWFGSGLSTGGSTTGIPPLDALIDKVNRLAYAHHIERLMVAGNWMLISGVSPNEAYRWFMTMFVDAYEWVMVPNVYGMAYYATGTFATGANATRKKETRPIMMNRPYFSSSSYIARMSDYSKGKSEEWPDIWDAFYYNFIGDNAKLLSGIYSIAAQVKNWKKKSQSEKRAISETVKAYRKKQ